MFLQKLSVPEDFFCAGNCLHTTNAPENRLCKPTFGGVFSGATDPIRTDDLLITSVRFYLKYNHAFVILHLFCAILSPLSALFSLPSWLNDMAERADINFSGTLQEALKAKLNIG